MMTAAEIQDGINRRGQIDLPSGTIELDAPLVIRAYSHLVGHGDTRLVTRYSGPVFVTPTDQEPRGFSIRRLVLEGGGIRLGGDASFFELENIEIEHAACAIESVDGAWMATLRKVWARECVDGFRVTGGTTWNFHNCFASYGSGQGWNLSALYASTLTACAMDGHTAPHAARFAACRGLTINGFDMENNRSDGPAVVLFDACETFTVNGLWSVGNRLVARKSDAAHLIHISGGSGVFSVPSLGGAPRPTPDLASGHPTGWTIALVLGGAPRLVFLGGSILPATKTVPGQLAFGVSGDTSHVTFQQTVY